MSTPLSVSEIFRKLEERIKLQEEPAAFHSQQEIHPREQSAFYRKGVCPLARVFQRYQDESLDSFRPARAGVAQPGASAPGTEHWSSPDSVDTQLRVHG